MIKVLAILLLFTINSYATQIVTPTSWSNGDTVTAAKLNGNQNAITTVVNGSLDNTNMASGYKLFQVVSSLPSPGNQGAVAFLTSNNTLNLDNGSAWLATITPSGTLATGKIPYYNGGWQLLSPGAQYLSLVSNGTSSLPTYQQIDLTPGRGATGTLAIINGGTGQTTQQTAIDALLPSQTSNSGKFLTTNGTTSSWGTPTIGLKFISSSSFTSTVTLDPTKAYLARIFITGTTSGTKLGVQFNADTGTNYNVLNNAATGAITTASDQIRLSANANANANSNEGFFIEFRIFPQNTNTTKNVWVEGMSLGGMDGGYAKNAFSGVWAGTATLSSMAMVSSAGTVTGTIYLYE